MLGIIRETQARLDAQRAFRTHPEVVMAVAAYDPALEVHWDRGINRWVVLRRTEKGLFKVKTWQNADGSFRALGRELVQWLGASDMWRQGRTADSLHLDMRRQQEAAEERITASFADDIEHIGRMNRRQMQRAKDLLGGVSGRFEGGGG